MLSDADDESTKQLHVNQPFFSCITAPGFKEGACGSCLWHLSTCEYDLTGRDEVCKDKIMQWRCSPVVEKTLEAWKLSHPKITHNITPCTGWET